MGLLGCAADAQPKNRAATFSIWISYLNLALLNTYFKYISSAYTYLVTEICALLLKTDVRNLSNVRANMLVLYTISIRTINKT